MSNDEMDIEDNASDLEEDEIDEELALPPLLASLKAAEKRELLRFKRSHNERDWEEEILRRSDLLARKVDMERLKRMTGTATKPAGKTPTKTPVKAKGKGKGKRKIESDEEENEDADLFGESEEEEPVAKKAKAAPKGKLVKGKGKKGKAVESEEDEGEDDGFEPSEGDEDEEGESDDDLFDSDEEEAISNFKKNKDGDDSPVKSSKVLGKRKVAIKAPTSTTKTRKSRATEEDDEDGEIEDEDGEPTYKPTPKKSALDRVHDDSGDEQSEDELNKTMEIKEEEDTSEVAEHADYLRIQSRRGFIIQWINEPYFETAIMGSFVRVPVGQEGERVIYKMCEVVAVEQGTGRAYPVPDCDKLVQVRLTLSIAGALKTKQKIDSISNSRITDVEFVAWKTKMLEKYAVQPNKDCKLLTKNQIAARRKKIMAATEHTYTHEEIRRMVANKSGINKSLVTEYSTAMESLLKKLAEAKAEEDYDLMDTVQKTIEKLEDESARQREANERASKHSIEVNKRSRESNVRRDMAAGMRKRQEDLEAAASGKLSSSVTDPFIRRDTKPKILWNTGSKLNEEREREENGGVKAATPRNATTNANDFKENSAAASAANATSTLHTGGELFTIKGGDENILEIRKRVKARLGVDPIALLAEDAKTRYLKKVCKDLPPIGSAERAALRGNAKSLEEIIEMVRLQREQE